MSRLDPNALDDGIREAVLLLRKAGYKTFTSCEGGRGHAFPEPTIGLKVQGDYFRFRNQLVKCLHSQGRWFFEVTLVSSYHQTYPHGKHYVYLQGFDMASPDKRKKICRSITQNDRRLICQLERQGFGHRVKEWQESRGSKKHDEQSLRNQPPNNSDSHHEQNVGR